jgi:hypothetical protein
MYIHFFCKIKKIQSGRAGPALRAEATTQARHDVLGSCKHYIVLETTLAQWTLWYLTLLNWMEQQRLSH